MIESKLSPWPVRLMVYAVLVAAAIAAIHLIDQRAMSLQHQFDQQQQAILEDTPSLLASAAQAPVKAAGLQANHGTSIPTTQATR